MDATPTLDLQRPLSEQEIQSLLDAALEIGLGAVSPEDQLPFLQDFSSALETTPQTSAGTA